MKSPVSYEVFNQIDIRVDTIVRVEDIVGADNQKNPYPVVQGWDNRFETNE